MQLRNKEARKEIRIALDAESFSISLIIIGALLGALTVGAIALTY